jgi:hypothetical protein
MDFNGAASFALLRKHESKKIDLRPLDVLLLCVFCAQFLLGSAAFGQVQFRPVVTLLTQFPAPTAPKDKQWLSQTLAINQTIPDNQPSGINSDVTTTDYFNGSCQQLFGIEVDIAVTHQRAADLLVVLAQREMEKRRSPLV